MGSSPISGTREPELIFSSFCAPRFARARARDREPPTSLALDRRLLPLPRRLAPHASQELQRSSLASPSPCVFLGRYYLRLPASPRTSPYLPASPWISLTVPRREEAAALDRFGQIVQRFVHNVHKPQERRKPLILCPWVAFWCLDAVAYAHFFRV